MVVTTTAVIGKRAEPAREVQGHQRYVHGRIWLERLRASVPIRRDMGGHGAVAAIGAPGSPIKLVVQPWARRERILSQENDPRGVMER